MQGLAPSLGLRGNVGKTIHLNWMERESRPRPLRSRPAALQNKEWGGFPLENNAAYAGPTGLGRQGEDGCRQEQPPV